MVEQSENEQPESFWKKFRYECFGPPVILALILLFSFTEFYLHFEYLFDNIRYKSRESTDPESHEDLMIIQINDSSLDDLGRWPWDRSRHYQFLKLLQLRQPSVISFDIMFPEASGSDFLFAEGMSYNSHVITGALSELIDFGDEDVDRESINAPWAVPVDFDPLMERNIQGSLSRLWGSTQGYPLEALELGEQFGFLETDKPGDEGYVRRIPLVYVKEGQVYATQALEAALRYWGIVSSKLVLKVGEALILDTPHGEKRIPINERGEYIEEVIPIDLIHGDFDGIPEVSGFEKMASISDASYYTPNERVFPKYDKSGLIVYPAVYRVREQLIPSALVTAILASSELLSFDVEFFAGQHLLIHNEDFDHPERSHKRKLLIHPKGYIVDKTSPILDVVGDVEGIYGFPTALYPEPVLQEFGEFGFVDTEASRVDGIRRKIPLVLSTGGHVYPSLVLKTLLSYWDVNEDSVKVVLGEFVSVKTKTGERKIPINHKGEFFINYRGEETYKAIGYANAFSNLYAMQEEGEAWPEEALSRDPKGRILVIGQTSAGLSDLGPTPFKGRSPLVCVQANAMDNILKEDYLIMVPNWPVLLATLLLMWVTVFLLKDRLLLLSIGVPTALIVLYVILSFWIFRYYSIQLPFVWPIVSFVCVHLGAYYLHWKKESEQKSRIKGMFGTYLSPDLVNQMMDSGSEPQLGGVDMEISAFFSDVQSFSSFSEQLTPTQLVDLMNEYLTAMTRILMDNGCFVDKYIGDAIVGIYNAPVALEGHALKGCIACILQHKRLDELREKWKSEGDKWPDIVGNMQARIGMNTGWATVGNMGSEDRFNYTMMGDTVNLAARCESGAKAYGVYTMVTGETKVAAEKSGDDCVFRYLDKIIVKGRSQPAEMYEVVCLRDDLKAEIENCLEVYDAGIKAYLGRDFKKAVEQFEKASALEPNRKEKNPHAPTTPSLVMLERAQEYSKHPPPDDWDGVFTMTSK